MTEQAIVAIIMCICNHMNTSSAKLACLDTYANCSIYSDGRARETQYKSKRDFIKTCNFHPSTSLCVDRFGVDH
jgi:hypothetical protein